MPEIQNPSRQLDEPATITYTETVEPKSSDRWQVSGTPSLVEQLPPTPCAKHFYPRPLPHVASALCCICRNGIPQDRLTVSAGQMGVNSVFGKGLRAGQRGNASVTLPRWLISSSVIPAVFPSRLSPGLSSTPPCRLLRHLDVFTTSTSTRW